MIKIIATIGGLAFASLLLAIVDEVRSTIRGRECNRRQARAQDKAQARAHGINRRQAKRLEAGILSPSDYRALRERGELNDLIRKGF